MLVVPPPVKNFFIHGINDLGKFFPGNLPLPRDWVTIRDALKSSGDDTHSSRSRLIAAARALFSEHGYEATSTAAIARRAGSAETQMTRLFGGKAGLLEAVFNESWRPLNERIEAIAQSAPSAREALLRVLSSMIAAFGSDPGLAFLVLLEDRRQRGDGREISVSRGLAEFTGVVRRLIARGQRDRSLVGGLSEDAVASALMGAAEGMIRDHALARRSGRPGAFSKAEIRTVFEFMLGGLSSNG